MYLVFIYKFKQFNITLVNLPIIIVAHHGKPKSAWIKSRPCCTQPVGKYHLPRPSVESAGSPAAFK
jgi:hypothetical protein